MLPLLVLLPVAALLVPKAWCCESVVHDAEMFRFLRLLEYVMFGIHVQTWVVFEQAWLRVNNEIYVHIELLVG